MLTIEKAAHYCGGRLFGSNFSQYFVDVSTDTRTLRPGSLFFALRGERYDGHQFLAEAFQKGTIAAVIDQRSYSSAVFSNLTQRGKCFVVVPDVYKALGQIASAYRAQFKIPIVTVTGSGGKTTTKECIKTLLSKRFRVCAGSGNLNNYIGLPLNLFRLTERDEVAVFELGANARGEINYLSSLAKPTLGVITCVYPVHLEGFSSLEGVYDAKLELGTYLSKNKGTLIINGDDPRLVQKAKKLRVHLIQFGHSQACEYRISKETQDQDTLRFVVNDQHVFALQGFGLFNTMNALAALAVAGYLGFRLEDMSQSWKKFVSIPNRFEIEHLRQPNIQLVKDCYNANPAAFSLALKSFETLSSKGKKIVVAGDMKELGEEAEKYHRQLGWELAGSSVDFIVAVGEYAPVVVRAVEERRYGLPAVAFFDNASAAEFLASVLCDGDSVLLKGSRSAKLEEIVEVLKSEKQTQLVS